MKLLDLFCGAGGCSVGYYRAGFTDITGVDINPQPRYPFPFVQVDAIEYLKEHGHNYDVIHASPPCQAYSITKHIHGGRGSYPDLVEITRRELEKGGKIWVIENVTGSPLQSPITLCGLMFDLKVLRHREFESSEKLNAPKHPRHPEGNLTNAGRGYSRGEQGFVCVAGHNFSRVAGAKAMGIGWMNRYELSQAIPPDYTEHIGRQLYLIIKAREHDSREYPCPDRRTRVSGGGERRRGIACSGGEGGQDAGPSHPAGEEE